MAARAQKKVTKPTMEDFTLKTDYHPNRTLVALGFAVSKSYEPMLELFRIFGQVQLFYVLPHFKDRIFPSMAVVQYSSVSEARCAMHGLKDYYCNIFTVKQPWAGTFSDTRPSRHLPIPRAQFKEEITRRFTLIVENVDDHQPSLDDLEELKRFGIMSVKIHPNRPNDIIEVNYRSPLSATLAMVGVSNPWYELRLVRKVSEIRRYSGVFLDRYRHLNIIDNFQPGHVVALYFKLKDIFSHKSLFVNPATRPTMSWQVPSSLQALIMPVDQDNKVHMEVIVKISEDQIQDAIRTGKVKDSEGIDLGLKQILPRGLIIKIEQFDVYYANKFEKEAFILYIDENNRRQIDVSETPKTGYRRWVSVFELMISTMRQYDKESKKWKFCLDAKIHPVNYLFKELVNDILPNVDPGTLLACPEILTYTRIPISKRMMNGEERLSNAGRGIPKVRLEANLKNVSTFRIPMIVYDRDFIGTIRPQEKRTYAAMQMH